MRHVRRLTAIAAIMLGIGFVTFGTSATTASAEPTQSYFVTPAEDLSSLDDYVWVDGTTKHALTIGQADGISRSIGNRSATILVAQLDTAKAKAAAGSLSPLDALNQALYDDTDFAETDYVLAVVTDDGIDARAYGTVPVDLSVELAAANGEANVYKTDPEKLLNVWLNKLDSLALTDTTSGTDTGTTSTGSDNSGLTVSSSSNGSSGLGAGAFIVIGLFIGFGLCTAGNWFNTKHIQPFVAHFNTTGQEDKGQTREG